MGLRPEEALQPGRRLDGLRTLSPYLTFTGDTKFAYLGQGGADYDADQAMLDQASGTATTSPARPFTRCTPRRRWTTSTPTWPFERGGACYTTIPRPRGRRREALRVGAPADRRRHRDEQRRRPVGLPRLGERRLQVGAGRPGPRPVDGVRPSGRLGGGFTYTSIHELPATSSGSRTRTTRSADSNVDGTPPRVLGRLHVGVRLHGGADHVRLRPSCGTRSSTRRRSPAATRPTT